MYKDEAVVIIIHVGVTIVIMRMQIYKDEMVISLIQLGMQIYKDEVVIATRMVILIYMEIIVIITIIKEGNTCVIFMTPPNT